MVLVDVDRRADSVCASSSHDEMRAFRSRKAKKQIRIRPGLGVLYFVEKQPGPLVGPASFNCVGRNWAPEVRSHGSSPRFSLVGHHEGPVPESLEFMLTFELKDFLVCLCLLRFRERIGSHPNRLIVVRSHYHVHSRKQSLEKKMSCDHRWPQVVGRGSNAAQVHWGKPEVAIWGVAI